VRNRRAWTSSPTSWTWLASRLFKRPEATWSLCQPPGRSASDHDAALVQGSASEGRSREPRNAHNLREIHASFRLMRGKATRTLLSERNDGKLAERKR
jgi:hypothetical protein